MKFRMSEKSLFAILLRSSWWVSIAVAAGIALVARMALPEQYMYAGMLTAIPFLGIGIVTAWRQLRSPKPHASRRQSMWSGRCHGANSRAPSRARFVATAMRPCRSRERRRLRNVEGRTLVAGELQALEGRQYGRRTAPRIDAAMSPESGRWNLRGRRRRHRKRAPLRRREAAAATRRRRTRESDRGRATSPLVLGEIVRVAPRTSLRSMPRTTRMPGPANARYRCCPVMAPR